MRASSIRLVLIAFASIGIAHSVQESRLFAPTYYIAADADWKGLPDQMMVKGASNLPPGTRLSVDVYESLGRGSNALNQDAIATVNADGFFEVHLRPKPGTEFSHKLVCEVVFMTTFPHQDTSVLQIVGKNGEHLGFPKNPQARVVSGGYYLLERIYMP